MTNKLSVFVLVALMAISRLALAAGGEAGKDWPGWRGPTGDGIAAAGQNPPTQWSETENVLWKVPLPGRGHGSPTVMGKHIYVATSDPVKHSQSILCLDRATGKTIWQTLVHTNGGESGMHPNSSAASSTVAGGDGRIYINFLNSGAIHTSALDLDGKVLWQRKVCDYVVHQGFAASPVLHDKLVLVSADHKGGGVLAGLDQATGEIRWSQSRPKLPNYTTPAIVKAHGKTQMVLAGCNLIASLDPVTGRKLWEREGSTEECVTTVVTDGERVFVSGGYPRNHVAAIEADGSGKIAWQNPARVYVPSMLVKDGHLYAVMDGGFAVCWEAGSGKELWKERLGGEFFGSPVMVGNRVYASNLAGKTFVFEVSPSGLKVIAQNQLGTEMYASPVICDSRIYLRVANKGTPRSEYLYCIGR